MYRRNRHIQSVMRIAELLLNHQLAEKLNAYHKEVGGEPVPPPQSSSDRPATLINPLQPISIGEVNHQHGRFPHVGIKRRQRRYMHTHAQHRK